MRGAARDSQGAERVKSVGLRGDPAESRAMDEDCWLDGGCHCS
jgi:hypothetical protein